MTNRNLQQQTKVPDYIKVENKVRDSTLKAIEQVTPSHLLNNSLQRVIIINKLS